MVAPESASTQERFYLPELDTLRFVAFLTVFLHHSLNDPVSRYVDAGLPQSAASMIVAVLRAGMFGVDLFFLLSSFLITSLLVREYRGTGTIDVNVCGSGRCTLPSWDWPGLSFRACFISLPHQRRDMCLAS
jgi:peptidoglycan/LPS O-acetylase OafA/YrhL